MTRKAIPLSRVYRLLEPGPVVLITTAHRGQSNVMTASWHTMMEFEPPLVGCVISGHNYTFDLLRASRECVINIPPATLAKAVAGCGNVSGRRVDKFARFGLTAAASRKVAAPRIEECHANLECAIADTRMVNKYNFFVLEVVAAWIDPAAKEPRTLHHAGRGVFEVAGSTVRLASKMK
jgi:flavin reductase (DIM6/NTAB) family NADH-FMN oxidoreductase RutF